MTNLAEDMDVQWAVMDTQMNPRIQKMQEVCWLDEKLLAYEEELFSSEIGKNKNMVPVKRREKKAEDRDKGKIDGVKKEKKTCNYKNICA